MQSKSQKIAEALYKFTNECKYFIVLDGVKQFIGPGMDVICDNQETTKYSALYWYNFRDQLFTPDKFTGASFKGRIIILDKFLATCFSDVIDWAKCDNIDYIKDNFPDILLTPITYVRISSNGQDYDWRGN